jgi:chloride channel protein, CIC family
MAGEEGIEAIAPELTRWFRAFRAFASRLELYNFGRWLVLASLTGVIAGCGAALLTWGVHVVASLSLVKAVGFLAPHSGYPGATVWHAPQRPWVFLLVLPAAGLVVGWLIYRFAPEAEGHGTDAVIHAFHREHSMIRRRTAPIKLLASALTIGSGGSAGREGPVAQVGAGFASFLSRLLGLSPRDRRTLVVAGVAGGIGGMFRAPLGGAIFAIEVLYSDNEFESEALVPAVISSIVSYVVNNVLTGWESIFSVPPIAFTRPRELFPYLLLGVLVALVGRFYVWVFYGLRDNFFARLPVPRWTRPAVGALLVGVTALVLPEVCGSGYGWFQLTLDGQLPAKLLLVLIPAKIVATSFTISSGGSGGVFAPSLIIGGMTGAVFANGCAHVLPSLTPSPAACVLVGAGAFFSGAAKVPVASLILVAEMSSSYRLLVPMMLAGAVSFLLTRGISIYSEQVRGRVDSPAHAGEFEMDVLKRLRVDSVAQHGELRTVRPATPFAEIVDLVASCEQEFFPVINEDDELVGTFTVADVRAVMATPEIWPALVAGDLGVGPSGIVYLRPEDDLHTAVRTFNASGLPVLPILAGPPPATLMALVSYQEVLRAYDKAVRPLEERRA